MRISRPMGLAVQAMYRAIQKVTDASAASTVPMGWTYKLARRFPRTNQAKLLVIPQLGQGRPVRERNWQLCIPSCVCVDVPLGSGVSLAAVSRTPRQAAATASATRRAPGSSDRAAGGPE